MSLGLFDIVGPIMHGPSSNHTGGANRIGYMARQIMGGLPEHLTFSFHPIFMNFFQGQRSNIALMSGCLGFREDDERCNSSMKLAAEAGVSVDYQMLDDPNVSRDTMRVTASLNGIDWCINGISIGAGNIIISSINGIDVHLDGNGYVTLFLFPKGTNVGRPDAYLMNANPDNFKASFTGENTQHVLLCFDTIEPISDEEMKNIESSMGERTALYSVQADSMYTFAERSKAVPLFSTYAEILELTKEKPLIDVILEYESRRSLRSKEDVLLEGLRVVDVIEKSMKRGLEGDNALVGGLCTGNDGNAVYRHSGDPNNICGYIFNVALARALAMAEINASAGRVVAVPTAGSAGTLPGTLFTVAERYKRDRAALAEAFLVAAAIGIVIGNSASFSGGTTGCQSEVGVGACMAAGGSAYLAGADPETIIHAAVLALKNVFGLSCDCPASPVEIPCIKRNAMGVSVALMAAELALSGVRSVLPPDDIVYAFADTQKWMPTELCNADIGGLAATPYAKVLKEKWNRRLEELRKFN
jgi:L-serine dehydratase